MDGPPGHHEAAFETQDSWRPGSARNNKSPDIDDKLVSDPRTRRTIPLPRTLPELQHHAHTHFGHKGRLRMYHRAKEVVHPSMISNIAHDDVVKVRADRRKLQEASVDIPLTTHQAHYVRHPLEPPVQPAGTDDESSLTDDMRGKKLGGPSCYKRDYVPHPPHGPEEPADVGIFKTHVKNHGGNPDYRTSYAMHYPWKDVQEAPPPCGTDDASVLTDAMMGKPLDASTIYQEHYVPKRPATHPSFPLGRSVLTEWLTKEPFHGQSTYDRHYVKKPLTGRQPSARPPRDMPGERPFQAGSEYRRNYDPKELGKPLHCHLEHVPNRN